MVPVTVDLERGELSLNVRRLTTYRVRGRRATYVQVLRPGHWLLKEIMDRLGGTRLEVSRWR